MLTVDEFERWSLEQVRHEIGDVWADRVGRVWAFVFVPHSLRFQANIFHIANSIEHCTHCQLK